MIKKKINKYIHPIFRKPLILIQKKNNYINIINN